MATVSFASFFQLIFFLGLGGGLPLGVPPLPEDPLLSRVAPEPCLVYLSWSGTATPDPTSANQVEQLLAEPEVQAFLSAIEKAIEKQVTAPSPPRPRLLRPAMTVAPRPADKRADVPAIKEDRVPLRKDDGVPIRKNDGPPPGPSSEVRADLFRLGKTLLTRPAAVYLAELKIAPGGPPEVRGGAIVALGDQAAGIKALLEKFQAMLPPDVAEGVEIDGAAWNRLRPGPGAPVIIWGTKGEYLIAAVGEGELEALLQRARGDAPKWLADVRRQLPVERVSTVGYLNVKGLLAALAPVMNPQATAVIRALGLGNVASLAGVGGLDATGYVAKRLVALDGPPDGLLQLCGPKPLAAADLAPIPADATIALAARLDAYQAVEAFLAVVEKVDPRERTAITTGLRHMRTELGFDLREDLLKSLGDTWRVYNSPGEGGLVLTGLTAVVSVKDPQRLAGVQEKILAWYKHRATLPRGERVDRVPFAGKDIYVLDATADGCPVAPAWCLTDKELIVALFPQNVKAYLSRGSNFRSLAEVPEVAKLLAADGGPTILCYADTPRIFEMVYPLAPLFGQLLCGELRRSGVDFSVAMLPSAPAIARHLRPAVAAVRRTPAGIEVTSQGSPPGGGAAALVPMAVAIAGFRVSHASVAVGRAQATAENRLGEAAAQRGQADEAIHHFRRALAMAPASAETHADLGKALLSRGQIDEAIAHFRKALELQPDNAEARKSLENALRQREQPGTAK